MPFRLHPHQIIVVLLAGTALFAADDKPAEPQSVKHRVTGLFASYREDDLRAAVEKLPAVKLVGIDIKQGEATFIYDAEKLLDGPKPDQVIERFDNLLRNHSMGTFGIKPLVMTPKDKLTLIEIPVVGLDCKGCALGAYESISGIDGVAQATVSFQDNLVTALIEPSQTDRAALETALTKRGVALAGTK